MPKRNEKQSGKAIRYQNKDITSKIFGEGMKEKSLAVYGISVPRIVDVLPTNLPAIEANELRMDNLFKTVQQCRENGKGGRADLSAKDYLFIFRDVRDAHQPQTEAASAANSLLQQAVCGLHSVKMRYTRQMIVMP